MSVSDSPLLRCLAQLNDDVWTEILLPQLLADGSAPAAALTCSRLRQLCQRSRQQLKLTSLDSANTATVRRWTEQLPQRFPACESVLLKLCEIESFPTAPVIVDALSRMPALSSLTLEVTLGQQSVALAVVLSSISSRLAGLRDLTLACADSWEDGAQLVWEQLGSVTQVTCLEVLFGADDRGSEWRGCVLPHLAPLRSLTGLQQLRIDSCKRLQQGGEGQQGGGFGFLEELTALTHLDIAVQSTCGLASISSCTALQVLRLRPMHLAGTNSHLSDADWEAIGQLGRLTKLHISHHSQPRSLTQQQPFLDALSNLSRLEFVGACAWMPAALPVFASLPLLRCIRGCWMKTPSSAGSGVVCEQVTRLEHAILNVDINEFSLFPSLEVYCSVAGSLTTEAWHSMTASCPKLRDMGGLVDATTGLLDFTQVRNELPTRSSFSRSAPDLARVSALRSLSQLTALTRLSFRSDQPLEAAALADAVPPVRELHFVSLRGLKRECLCLTPLAKLAEQSLNRLFLYFAECPARTQDVQVLLCAMSRVPKVVVAGPPAVAEFLESTVESARVVGLSLPEDLHVVCLRSQ